MSFPCLPRLPAAGSSRGAVRLRIATPFKREATGPVLRRARSRNLSVRSLAPTPEYAVAKALGIARENETLPAVPAGAQVDPSARQRHSFGSLDSAAGSSPLGGECVLR